MKEIRVYSGVRSPYSRLGMHIIQRSGIEARSELKVSVVPFLAPPNGVPFANPTDNPLKLAYIMADAPRMSKRLGLEMAMPEIMDPDYKPAQLAQFAATGAGHGVDFACAIGDARWGKGLDISDLNVLADCATQIGWCASAMKAAIQGDGELEFKKIRMLIEKDSVFGVPFAVVEAENGIDKYWGHERMDLLVEDLTDS